jgi:hypothetical protein
LAQSGPCLILRLGLDEIPNGFSLKQIHLAVRHGTPSEFAWTRETSPEAAYVVDYAAEDKRIAMSTDFNHVFPGVGVRTGKQCNEDIVDLASVFAAPQGAHRLSRFEAGESGGADRNLCGMGTGNADDADCASAIRGRQRDDRVAFTG